MYYFSKLMCNVNMYATNGSAAKFCLDFRQELGRQESDLSEEFAPDLHPRSWRVQGFHEILGNILGYYGIFWDIMGFYGI